MRRALLVGLGLTAAACHATPAPGGGAATCARVADHVQALLPADDHGKRVRAVVAARCDGDAWDGEVRACMLDEPDLHARHHCQDRMTAEQRTAFARALVTIDHPDDAAAPSLPEACQDYAAAIEALDGCAKIPVETRTAMREAYQQAAATWATLPASARPNLIEGCAAGTTAMRQILIGCGP